jgi:membrane-bound lytic murein transglycosylase D
MNSNLVVKIMTYKRSASFLMMLILCGCSISTTQKAVRQSSTSIAGSKIKSSDVSPTVDQEIIEALRTVLTWKSTLTERHIPTVIGLSDDNQTSTSSIWTELRSGFKLQAYYDHASRNDQISYYLSQENYFEAIAERGYPFFSDIVRTVQEHGLPLEVALLPLVESALVTTAVSNKNAAGLWQFTRATGKSYGLPSDEWYEARFDPIRSTLAAVEYLKYLATLFNNQWLVVFAAYNMGENELIARATRVGLEPSNENIWEIRIPHETRNHIARILALANILEKPSQYSVNLSEFEDIVQYENVDTANFMSFNEIAKHVDLSVEDISKLNPAYLKNHTHPVYPQYILLPVPEARKLKTALNL